MAVLMRTWFLMLACGLLLSSTPALAGTARSEALLAAAAALRANCEICHDRGMVAQQRLTPAQWQAEVEKMRKWGSPLPADQEKALVDYLSGQFPVTAVPMAAPESPGATFADSVKPLADPARFHGDSTETSAPAKVTTLTPAPNASELMRAVNKDRTSFSNRSSNGSVIFKRS